MGKELELRARGFHPVCSGTSSCTRFVQNVAGACMSEVSRVMDVLLVLLRYGTQASVSDEESKAGGDTTSAGQPSSGSIVRSRSKLGRKAPLPLQVLQMLGGYLEADDLASARLVSQEWREQLSAQVTDIQLPAHLWQYCVPGQLVTLYRLLDTFKHVQQVRLRIVPQHPVDSWSIGRAMDTLRLALPTLQTVELASITQAGHWRAVLVSMQCFTQQLTNLRLQDICWPPPDALHLISAFTSLQRLEIASPHFSRLEPAHVEAIGQLRLLRELHLCFRTVTGTANTPLGLDPLSSLVRLTQLNVQYTGLLELSSAVVFCQPAALRALSSLQQLSVSLIPMPSLAALAQLPQLGRLVLRQAQPISSSQCLALARCRHLRDLSLSSVQWSDVAHLAPLTGLTGLCVQMWQPLRGSLPGDAAGQHLLHLRTLRSLRQLQLKGQCELSAELLVQLASHWHCLTGLDLCCVLPDGTQGLQHFTTLRSLRLRPYKWDVWSSEPPVLLYPSLLPASLTELQGIDVWCLDELPTPRGSSSSASGVGHSGSMHRSSSYCGISGILSGMSSVGRDLCQLGGAFGSNGSGDGIASPGSGTDGITGTGVMSEAACCIVATTQQQQPAEQKLVAAAAAAATGASQPQTAGSLLLLQTPSLKRLVLRSTSPFDRRLLMPDLSMCSQLEYLELHHSQLNQCHVQHIAAICAHSLRSLKLVAVDDGARIRFSGLTVLTRLTALTSLSVHAHERAINKNVRRAIASMSQLRNLTLLTSPDYPSAFARNLACLTQLTNLMVLRVGLGFGALDALRRLGVHVSKSLPHCTYQMLTDGCAD